MDLIKTVAKWLEDNEIWFQKGKTLFETLIEVKNKKRVAIAVIAVWFSFGRSGLVAKSFLKKVKRACKDQGYSLMGDPVGS